MKHIGIVPSLTTADVFRRQSADLRTVLGGSRLLLRYGRDALRVCISVLGIGCRDEVLVPAAICEVVLDAFSERDIRLRYYGLSDSLDFDVEDIEARIGPQTSAIYMTHPLGRPLQTAALRTICDRHGLILIEDCAHALGGASSQGEPLGMRGDFAIYSYRKFFPLPDGGGLQVNRTGVRLHRVADRVTPTRQLSDLGKQVVLGIAASIGVPGALWRQRAHYRNPIQMGKVPESSCHANLPRGISTVSRWLLSRVHMKDMITRRRDNFAYCLRKVRSLTSVEPLYKDLLPGQVPYSFPLLVESRTHIVNRAAADGIVLEPTLAPVNRRQSGLVNPNESFDALDRITERVISLPIHQGMTSRALDRVLDIVRCASYERD